MSQRKPYTQNEEEPDEEPILLFEEEQEKLILEYTKQDILLDFYFRCAFSGLNIILSSFYLITFKVNYFLVPLLFTEFYIQIQLWHTNFNTFSTYIPLISPSLHLFIILILITSSFIITINTYDIRLWIHLSLIPLKLGLFKLADICINSTKHELERLKQAKYKLKGA